MELLFERESQFDLLARLWNWFIS